MSWTTPKTWSALEVVLATDLNTHLRDNLSALWLGSGHGDMDFYASSTTKARIAAGTANQVLTVNALTSHPTFEDSPQNTMTTKGDLLWRDSLNSLGRLAIGTDGQSLRADSGSPVWVDEPRFVLLQTPLKSTDWDGDSRSTTAKTLIDLSSVFGVPAGVKAVYVKLEARDSASSGSECWVILSSSSYYHEESPTEGSGMYCCPWGRANDTWEKEQMIVACDEYGDIYYQVKASGTNTLDCWLSIWGYWI